MKTPVVMECSLLEKLQHCASTDFLTSIYNRHFFHDALAKEIARAGRTKACFSLMFFDIDDFKIFNDAYGHQKGDEVLVQIASVIKTMLRAQDVPCRYGGDEFICLLPDTNYFYALSIAERVRKNIINLPSDMGLEVNLSLAYGIATYPTDGDKSEELIKTCDMRLYDCKEETDVMRKRVPRERRTAPRIKTPNSRGFLYKNQYEKLDVGIVDIGQGGLSFTSREPTEPGSIYQMQLFLKPPLSTAWAEVEMLYLQNLASGEYRVGCRLTGINFT
jgi:diguanylate cyclase (GGDEF)-like protein